MTDDQDMGQTCTKCSRVNPEGAAYCYHDGAQLAGHSRNGGPVAVGSRPFRSPFVFPSGRQCRTFDELALACQENWPAARDLLREGFFESFLGGLGRADLALAAREAARFPDHDRGLDQLLGHLPTGVVEPPRLAVAPQEVSLGALRVGEDRRCELHLENRGMRLLYGSVSCDDCDWLALGDAPGGPEKLFQFGSEALIPVHVKGQRLRAGKKPLEGRLTVESNGGTVTVLVRADVPIRPYPEGVLKGALTPRQVAEKAKAAPKEAASCFESGAVAEWYGSNGWVYPVHGPAATGLGAVQQFFEALGLTPPPKVDISERAVTLEAVAGTSVTHVLEVRSPEKRPVYAHATSDAAWLEVGRPKLNGRVAAIPIVVPSVPDRAGETLTARVTVRANGNQRFVVPVTLIVGGNLNFAEPAAPRPAPAQKAAVTASPPKQPSGVKPAAARAPAAVSVPPVPVPRAPAFDRQPLSPLHLVPVAALLLVLVVVTAVDWFGGGSPSPQGRSAAGDPTEAPYPATLKSTEPRLGIDFDPRRRFGIIVRNEQDPNNKEKRKRLTYEENGSTNNTCVKVDGNQYLFGNPGYGKWVKREQPRGFGRKGWDSVYEITHESIVVTQSVDLVPGEQTQLLDTVLVRYALENRSENEHTVGLRVMLDTFIGDNDGVPFTVPGGEGQKDRLVDSLATFEHGEIPDYVQALERPDLADPGTVAHLGLKLPDFEPLERMIICRWPGNKDMRWEMDPLESMRSNAEKPDSCVVLYWPYESMKARAVRKLAFTYGLGSVSGAGGADGAIALTTGGSTRPGREFTVTAYVKEPKEGQVVRLILPDGFSFAGGHEADKKVEAGGRLAQVSWRVRSAGRQGAYVIEAASGAARASLTFRTRDEGLY
jgi:hypothetical protein